MNAIDTLGTAVGTRSACMALNIHYSQYYRSRHPKTPRRRPPPPLKLSDTERAHVHALLLSPPFIDQAPATIAANLLDQGQYWCSARTMYRILHERAEVRERRRGHRRVHYQKPELLATAPDQVWSWDITKLKGPATWQYFHLYVILDLYSRYVVGWMIAQRESALLAKRLIAATCEKQCITADQLTLHADRGASMKSTLVAQLLVDLSVVKSHNRPHTSNDNPYSESQFKTLKYRPTFPRRFTDIDAAERHCRSFFDWYNVEHKHSGIAMLTPTIVHHGLANEALAARQAVLDQAFATHPERFKHTAPQIGSVPDAVWINPPKLKDED